MRFLSSGGGDGGDGDKGDGSKRPDSEKEDELFEDRWDDDDDPFGVSFEDGDDKVGPANQWPPMYKRDSATGKLTSEVASELTEEEKEILKMDPLERDQLLLKRVVQSWETDQAGDDAKTKDPIAMANFARRVRLAKMSLNVLGRSVQAQGATTVLNDGDKIGRDKETKFTQQLTKSEFKTFQKYMQEKQKTNITEEDVPVHDDAGASRASPFSAQNPLDDDYIVSQGITDESEPDPDNPDLSLKWLTSRARWQVSKRDRDGGPFDDLLPSDLNVSRLVNRKQAKILPTELLHHNNLALLRRYISPAGQIMHRTKTRLGARDQRRVARLIKRARKLGLIPHSGHFVVEDHGNIYEKDICEMKAWELELQRRGLVVQPKLREPRQGR